ncbi:GNAT family N-acetyltransferase [Paenibacillus tengchongensis]|uniref:GNAT family N-acetyltransferase n=1 Tax=Paenibacillus tengchongensis TaxID=2608684 RepID=UPI00124DD43F|nr:GNAT family N-acetyltransferase [Paenibacillus tengchongensis]
MTVVCRAYSGEPGFSADYGRVFDFLVRLNAGQVLTEGFLWGRWEWAFSLPYLETAALGRMGLWEDEGEVVAVAVTEQGLGNAWFALDPRYAGLKAEMLDYAIGQMSKDGAVKVLIKDSDAELQRAAACRGFRPTQEQERNAVLEMDNTPLGYTLPEGYRIVSLEEEYDLHKYNKVLWRGFDHKGPVPGTEEAIAKRRRELSAPHAELALKVAVAAPDGEFVAYCGMWHLPGSAYALVEPVAADPAYRLMGLGKAAVLEGVRRCCARGAARAFVGSSQQFYYNIGFRPYSSETWWEYDAGRGAKRGE